jgi:hypothetical protein
MLIWTLCTSQYGVWVQRGNALQGMSFFELLEARVAAVDSLLCVGLDPHAAQVSPSLHVRRYDPIVSIGGILHNALCPPFPLQLPSPTASAALAFCKQLIEATLPVRGMTFLGIAQSYEHLSNPERPTCE